MQKEIFITTDFHSIDKSRWAVTVKNFLNAPKVQQLHCYANSKIFFKKINTEGYPRLLFFEERRDDYALYIPRKYFSSHEEYDEFCAKYLPNLLKSGRYDYSATERKEIEEKFNSLATPERKPPLPALLRSYEYLRDFSHIETTYIYEMEEWIKSFKSDDIAYDKRVIFENLQQIIVNRLYDAPDEKGWIRHKLPLSSGEGEIVFRIQYDKNHALFFLFFVGRSCNIQQLNETYLSDDNGQSLPKKARKAYPEFILYGEFLDWINVENDSEANLALSEEEIDVLDNSKYPFFINGLAGSGKSTILYYLFAHAFSYRKENPEQNLMFLSYSPGLIKKAKDIIGALIRTNPAFNDYKSYFAQTEEERQILNDSFSPFIDFLRNKFLSPSEMKLFPMEKHIDFPTFQSLYARHCKLNVDKYSATIVWSVIRSFIKSRDHKRFFSLEDYKKLSTSDRNVLESDYAEIYSIFKNWYKHFAEEGYWDDLDLVRFVLKKMDHTGDYPQYDIIFCDEAQDFTPIEVKLICRLSKYTQFDLNDYKSIPIAFAGDPNQTVSPTGFVWSRVKDLFDQSFQENISSHPTINEKTLNNNYRSKRSVVRFANTLQYFRKCFITNETLKPQNQWNPQNSIMPSFFTIDSEEEKQFHRSALKNTVCIISGQEGENTEHSYLDHIIEDEFLKSIVIDELRMYNKTEAQTMNAMPNTMMEKSGEARFYTAISAKGQEFPTVVLYRFADHLPLTAFRRRINGDSITEAEKYELAHFFTKLYIAVTRAKEAIFILDSQENYDNFWSLFVDNKLINTLLSKRQDACEWKEKVDGIKLGDRVEYSDILEGTFDPEAKAEQLYQDARESQDPLGMERAAGYFGMAKRFDFQNRALAYAKYFRHIYKEAGNSFLRLNMRDEATQAFWEGACWCELLDHSEKSIYKRVAEYMLQRIDLISFSTIDHIASLINRTDDTWIKVVDQMNTDALKVAKDFIPHICGFLDKVVEQGFSELNETIAKLHFKVRKYGEAIRKWDDLSNTEHIDYYTAKRETAPLASDKIFWMSKLNQFNEILETYGRVKHIETHNLDDKAQDIIFRILLDRHYNSAIEYPYPTNPDEKMKRLFVEGKEEFFLLNFILKKFTAEKFFAFADILEKHAYLDENAFTKKVFEAIFALNDLDREGTHVGRRGRQKSNEPIPYWLYFFMYLKFSNKRSVIRSLANRMPLLDALKHTAASDQNHALCFLDYIFNTEGIYTHTKDQNDKVIEHIDFPFVNQFASSLAAIFCYAKPIVNRKTLALNSLYFAKCDLTDRQLQNIKMGMHLYAKKRIEQTKRVVSKHEYDDFAAFLFAYEITAPEQVKEGRWLPDFNERIKFYHSLKKEKRFAKMNDLLELKIIFNKLLLNESVRGACLQPLLSDLEEKNKNIVTLLTNLNRIDVARVLSILIKENDENLSKVIEPIMKVIYENNLNIDREILNLETATLNTRRARRNEMRNFIEAHIQRELQKSHCDIYLMKLLCYAYERLDSREALSYFENLIKRYGDRKLFAMVRYLKLRVLAICHRIYETKAFEKKQKEMGIMITGEAMIPDKPKIEREQVELPKPKSIDYVDKMVDRSFKVAGYEVQLERKTVSIVKNDDDVMMLKNGEVIYIDKSSHVVQKDENWCIDEKLIVSIATKSKYYICYDKTRFVIEFNRANA